MEYKLIFNYIYTFYSFGEALDERVVESAVTVGSGASFTLHQQEDGVMSVSYVREDCAGEFVILTFPNTDKICIHLGETVELSYDEYYSVMGDDNHNVYVGTVRLIKE